MVDGRASSWNRLAVFGGLVFCSSGEQDSGQGLSIPELDVSTFSRWNLFMCFDQCTEYKARGCCEHEECWRQNGPCGCWSLACQYHNCCRRFVPSEELAKQTQQQMRAQSLLEAPLPPRLCPPSRGETDLPELPPSEGSKQTQVPFAPGDVAIVVVTSTRSLESGIARAAAKTWVRRLPPHSVFFAREAAGREVQGVVNLGDVTILSIRYAPRLRQLQ
eukprot:TRINITY_DN27616_c0_g1_i1.p2 TRINITY_DN27616_c0_g1~~TRINITY_DN27616_c0_g1_i1.p2  ORF type:complete len:218 (-),score=33.26 TRINITY_DN27616_c0_g1_i1:904-1557(-)